MANLIHLSYLYDSHYGVPKKKKKIDGEKD